MNDGIEEDRYSADSISKTKFSFNDSWTLDTY